MRRIALFTVAAVFAVPAIAWCQQGNQSSASQNQAQSTSAPQQDSLAEAARKAREQRKQASKSSTVFTNDNLPAAGGISTVGDATQSPPTTSTSASSPSGQKPSTDAAKPANDEKVWREKFASLHHRLDQDQANLDVMQRELAVLNTQQYNDPLKGMQQGLTRDDINKKTADIDRMKAQVESDKQAISDAEDQLRKSGGDSGWER
jgi:hypothetical protein